MDVNVRRLRILNVWYAKCRRMVIVGVQKPPYLCTVETKDEKKKKYIQIEV